EEPVLLELGAGIEEQLEAIAHEELALGPQLLAVLDVALLDPRALLVVAILPLAHGAYYSGRAQAGRSREAGMTDQEAAALGAAALAEVKSGDVVGLGTGQAATAFIHALGRAMKDGLRVTGVPTSEVSATLARTLGIPLVDTPVALDVAVDGADEVDP